MMALKSMIFSVAKTHLLPVAAMVLKCATQQAMLFAMQPANKKIFTYINSIKNAPQRGAYFLKSYSRTFYIFSSR